MIIRWQLKLVLVGSGLGSVTLWTRNAHDYMISGKDKVPRIGGEEKEHEDEEQEEEDAEQ